MVLSLTDNFVFNTITKRAIFKSFTMYFLQFNTKTKIYFTTRNPSKMKLDLVQLKFAIFT